MRGSQGLPKVVVPVLWATLLIFSNASFAQNSVSFAAHRDFVAGDGPKLFASADLVGVAAEDGISLREIGLILLFCPLFAWIAFAFSTALAGFIALRNGGEHESLQLEEGGAPKERTAVLIPIYNEDVDGVVKRLRAMMRSVASTGLGDRFDFFLLSEFQFG